MKKYIFELLEETPGLKGRQIASKLGLDRKEVNSFLNKNRDEFIQDDRFCWSNKFPSKLEVIFPSKWINEKSFERVFKKVNEKKFSKISQLEVIIPSGCKFLLVSIARLLSIINQFSTRGISVTLDLINSSDTLSFFNRTGFYDYLDNRVKVLPDRPESSAAEEHRGESLNLVELGVINPEGGNEELIIQLGECFVAHSSSLYELVAKTVFSEIINNVSDHSDSTIDGFAGLQVYNGKIRGKHIQTVVSDSGKGIAHTLRTTLKKKHPELFLKYSDDTVKNNALLVKEAFINGRVSRYGKGRGLGFESSRKQAQKYDVDIFIRQTTFSIKLNYKNEVLINSEIEHDLVPIDGTHICFDIYLTKAA